MIVTLAGANDFLRRAELNKLACDFVTKYGDMGLEKLDGDEAGFERMQESLQSLPFLVERKMVILRTPSANKQFTEDAEKLFKELPETTDVILVEPKLDKRLSYYKFLKKSTDFREFKELDENGLAHWLVDNAKSQKAELSQSDARYLIERVGAHQQMLGNELDKIILYDSKITRANIELLTDAAPQSTIFELLDSAFAGNKKRVISLYEEQRALKVEPQQIIAMLTWQLHVLALIKAAGDKTSDEVASQAKLNPFVVRKSSGIARKLTIAELKKLIADLLKIDTRLKRESLNADDVLQNYLLKISA